MQMKEQADRERRARDWPELHKPKTATVSNFWIDCEIDGRRKKLEGGPKADDGGFRLEVSQRNEGRVERPLVIEGEQIGSGLVLRVWDHKGQMIYAHCTVR